MLRIILGAISASLFAVSFLILLGPPKVGLGVDRVAARVAMATEVIAQLERGAGRINTIWRQSLPPAPPRIVSVDVALLCQTITREAEAVVLARASGQDSLSDMLGDAGNDPVLAWLVGLAWAVVPPDGGISDAARFHDIVARDCAMAFA